MRPSLLLLFSSFIALCGCKNDNAKQPFYSDIRFTQDYAVKYYCRCPDIQLLKVVSDRNGYIQILSSRGLMDLKGGELLIPGTIEKDYHYKPLSDKNISGTGIYQDQIVYVDDKAVLSNAWAGKLYLKHSVPGARLFAGGKDLTFLVSDGKDLCMVNEEGLLWNSVQKEKADDILFDESSNLFYISGSGSVSIFNPVKKELKRIITCKELRCFCLTSEKLIAGTADGYLEFNRNSFKPVGEIHNTMPCNNITTIREIEGKLWFGSSGGAMMLRSDGKYNYYASERWLPSDTVVDIARGPGNSVLILTNRGLSKIIFKDMTLADKADYYEKQVRLRHIRNGFNATLSSMVKGDISGGSLEDSDNDGLWTSMYVAAEAFRYSVTGSPEALENVRGSLNALERLFTVNPVPGFPARSFERRGYKYEDKPWRRAEDPEWDWKSTTSSDEAIGHMFAYSVVAELINEPEIRKKAITLIDTLMSHIVKNNLYLIDWDGKPTRWARWNPEYVNSLPQMVGDRKLNSSNIISMLQSAYHFTGKEKYRKTAFDLMMNYGYLQNLMRPMNKIGIAPEDAGNYSKMLSEGWNHSDDEMYFCGYWGLFRYAFNDTLKTKYREAIIDHWKAERPEKEGLWNIMTSLTGTMECDLNEAIWYLQEHPMDLIGWKTTNSMRKDIEYAEPDFRRQTIKEVLPPDELSISRHNANRFDLDGNGDGSVEMSAGDIWLLPYWMGRYLGVISGPVTE